MSQISVDSVIPQSGTTITIGGSGDTVTLGSGASQSGFGSAAYAANASASTGAVNVDASDNLQFNSGYGSTATAYGCRAWVNFNGTGTVAIRDSANVSSITDNGTGDYTVNFTTAMPDANYCAVLSTSNESNGGWRTLMQWQTGATRTTSAIRMLSLGTDYSANPAGADYSYVDVAIFR